MSEWIKNLFVSIFGTHSDIATFLISMIPIVELRGAIPFGAAKSLWGEHALELWESFLISVLGGAIVSVLLAFIFWPIFKWLKNTKGLKKIATFIENKLNKNSKDIQEKTVNEKNEKRAIRLKFLGVFAFVAVPLPLTGVWTGTCVGLFIGLSKLQTLLACSLGNLVAGAIMMVVSYFFEDNTLIVVLIFLVLVAIFILFEVIRHFIEKHKKKKLEAATNDNNVQ